MPGQGTFEDTLAKIKEAKKNREEGKVNSIPFGLPTLDKHVPGIMRGIQYLTTASSGVGKTQLSKFLFVNQPYKFIKENPQANVKLKILYFALEESKEEFMYSLISNRLKVLHNITVDSLQLRGITNTLSDDVVTKIEECKDYFEDLERCIDVIDTISNPYGIMKYIQDYAIGHGTLHYRPHVFKSTLSDGTRHEETEMIIDRYEPSDPEEIVMVIIDHMSLLQPEKTDTLHEAMTQMSANYGRKKITKLFNYCLNIVQQQAADTEKQQFTNGGQSRANRTRSFHLILTESW